MVQPDQKKSLSHESKCKTTHLPRPSFPAPPRSSGAAARTWSARAGGDPASTRASPEPTPPSAPYCGILSGDGDDAWAQPAETPAISNLRCPSCRHPRAVPQVRPEGQPTISRTTRCLAGEPIPGRMPVWHGNRSIRSRLDSVCYTQSSRWSLHGREPICGLPKP